MLYTCQYVIVTKTIVVTFFIIKVFGLWPYKFQLSSHQTEYSLFSIIYSIFAPVIILCAYVYIGSDLYSESSENPPSKVFTSEPLQMILFSYSYLVIISCVILYAGQHLQYKRKKVAYFKCKKVADCMSEFIKDYEDVQPFVTRFFLKTLVYDILNFSLFVYSLSLVTDRLRSQPYLSILIYLPTYTIRLNTNVFYGGILFFNLLYKQLNGCLSKLLQQNQHLCEAELSDLNIQLEKASMLYFELLAAMKAFNSVFSFQITLWITTQLITLTTQYFFQYVAVVELIVNQNYFVKQNLTVLGAIVMSTYELLATGYACNSLVREVKFGSNRKAYNFVLFKLIFQAGKTTVILHKINSNFDVKLKSVRNGTKSVLHGKKLFNNFSG